MQEKVAIFVDWDNLRYLLQTLKMARINGMEVLIANFEEEDYLADELLAHCDMVRNRSLKQIDSNLS